uniref:Uncharacterized protein n=1 Tax=Oryza punctata TaxID=4537 RepID=A0A0E0LLF7_ORYPU
MTDRCEQEMAASPSPSNLGALVSDAIATAAKMLRAFLDDDYGMWFTVNDDDRSLRARDGGFSFSERPRRAGVRRDRGGGEEAARLPRRRLRHVRVRTAGVDVVEAQLRALPLGRGGEEEDEDDEGEDDPEVRLARVEWKLRLDGATNELEDLVGEMEAAVEAEKKAWCWAPWRRRCRAVAGWLLSDARNKVRLELAGVRIMFNYGLRIGSGRWCKLDGG